MSWVYRFSPSVVRWFQQQNIGVQEQALDLVDQLCDQRLPPRDAEVYQIRDFDNTGLFVVGWGIDGELLVLEIGRLEPR
ncbi:MAG: hypothetical protein AAF743_16440 [Planctomycetota bacterium]